MAIGRISGPLLKANLIRNGVDLAFETNLLYLDVSDPNPANHRIGIKTSDPSSTLQVVGTITTTNLVADNIELDAISVQQVNSDLIPGLDQEYDLGSFSKQWKSLTVGQIAVDALLLDGNRITIIDSNADIELLPVGSGTVWINSDTALRIPFGSELTRPSGKTAEIRFNSTNLQFEGYNSFGWVSLGATRDVDGDTRITAELETGTNDNTFRFFNGGVLTGVWDNQQLDIHKITVDDGLDLDTDSVSGIPYVGTTKNNLNLELKPNGTGIVRVPSNNAQFDQNISVLGTTTLSNTNITGTVNLTGTANITDVNVTNDLNVTGNIYGDFVQTNDIRISNNLITTTLNDSDLRLQANNLGSVRIEDNAVITGNLIVNTDVQIDGGDLTASTTTFNLLNTTVTTLNIGGDATTVEIGSTVGTTNVNNNLAVDGNVILGDTSSDTVTFNSREVDAPNTIVVGIDDSNNTFVSSPLNVKHTTTGTPANNIGVAIGYDVETGNGVIKRGMSLEARAVDVTSATEDFDFVVRLMEDGNLIAERFRVSSLGDATLTGNMAVQGGTISTISSTANVVNTDAQTVNFAGSASQVNIGSTVGVTNIKNSVDIDGNLNVDGSIISTTASTLNFANENTTTVNAFGAATSITIGADTGTTTVRNDLLVDGDITITDENEVRFREASSEGTNYVSIKAPTALADNYTIKLPVNNGRLGQLLATDGEDQLQWVAADTLVGNRLYVSAAFGDDRNNGFDAPVKTIKRAAELFSNLIYTPKRTVTQKEKDTLEIIKTNKEYLRAETIGFIDNNFAFDYDRSQCSRDTALIVQSLAFDALFDGDTQSVFAGLRYWAQQVNDLSIPEDQKLPTISAIMHAKDIAVKVVQDILVEKQAGNTETQIVLPPPGDPENPGPIPDTSSAATTIGLLFDFIVQIVTNIPTGISTTIFNNPNGDASTNDGILRAFSTLAANKTFIQRDTIAYINNNFAFTYDESICSRDTGLIVQSLAFDTLYQGGTQSEFAGLRYWSQGLNQVGSQEPETIASIEYARNIAAQIVLNTPITKSPGNGETQIFDLLNPGSGAGSAIISSNFNRVLDILANPSQPISETIINNGSRTTSNSILNTAQLLLDNKAFIVAEVLAFIDQNFNFTYDVAKCERDTGLIIDGVSYDIALGTNFNAVKSGLAYQRANSSNEFLKDNQLTQTIAALNFVKTEAAASLVSNGTAVARSNAAFLEIIDILERGQTGLETAADPIDYPNPTGASAPSAEVLAAKTQLINNRAFIQAEIKAFVDANFPPPEIDTAVCARDTGFILDALVYDLLYGGNSATIQAATAYFIGNIAVISRDYDIQKTVDAYNRLKIVVGSVVKGEAVLPDLGSANNPLSQTGIDGAAASSTEVDLLQNLIQIINTAIQDTVIPEPGDPIILIVPETVFPTLTWVDNGIISARSQLLLDKPAIITAQTTFIATTFQSLTTKGYDSADQARCALDLQHIVDSVTFDLTHGGNRQSTQAGVLYFRFDDGALDRVIVDANKSQLPQTLAAYDYLKDLVTAVILNQEPAIRYQTLVSRASGLPATGTQELSIIGNINRIKQIISDGPDVVFGSSSTFPINVNITPADYNANDLRAFSLLRANEDFIKAELNGFIQSTFSTIAGYDDVKCERDTGFIVDSVAFDLKYGGLRQSAQSGVLYYSNIADISVIQGQRIQTVAAYNYLKTVVAAVINGVGYTPLQNIVPIVIPDDSAYAESSVYGPIEANINTIINIIQVGPSVAPETQSISLTEVNNADVIIAHQLLRANQTFISAEINKFVDNTFTGLVYTKEICARDIGYIIDSVLYDMEYGGNAKSVYAGEIYYNATTSANIVVDSQKPETVAAIEHLRTIAKNVLEDENPSIRYTNLSRIPLSNISGLVNPPEDRTNETAAIQASFRIVSDTIAGGVGTVSPTEIDFGPGFFAATGSIFVASGDYIEDNPVIIPDNVSVIGSDLRSVIIRPKNSNRDIFRLRNGSYMYGFTWRDAIDPLTRVPQFTFAFATTFDNVADKTVTRGSYPGLPLTKPTITQSPYIQNVSIISFLGGSGALIDGALVDTPNVPAILEEVEVALNVTDPNFIPEQGRSMVANAYTMVTFGGVGWKLINDAYAQIVSCFQIFLRDGVLCQSGGYCSITNSATNFGIYALRASGYSANAFTFDRGIICETGVARGAQTITAIGMLRPPVNEFVIRIRDASEATDITTQFFTPRERFDFDPTSVDPATGVFTITEHGIANRRQVIYFANGGTPIGGLEEGSSYYVRNLGINQFSLFFDEPLTLPIEITSVGAGGTAPSPVIPGEPEGPILSPRHTFRFQIEEFFLKDRITTHTEFQTLALDPSGFYSFNPGATITGTTIIAGDPTPNNAFVHSYDSLAKEVTVALNEVVIDLIPQRVPFNDTSIIDLDQSTVPVSNIQVTETFNVSNLVSSTFTIESTVVNSLLQSVATLPGLRIWFHRPSIVNSSSHTWEYAGSGIDYNALPQNGGQTREEFEQFNEPPGRVYTSGTNELGDFKVGDFIVAENKTGNISFRNEVTVGQLNALRLSLSDIEINKISNDPGLGDNEPGGASDSALITQLSIRTFIANRLGNVVDKQVSTNANAGALVQLNSSGQINRDLIPPLRTTNTVTTVGFRSRLDVSNDQPAIDVLASDTVVETYQSRLLTLDNPITVASNDLVKQAVSGATGRVVFDVTAGTTIELADITGTFDTTNQLTDEDDVAYSGPVIPTNIGPLAEQQIPFVLTIDTISQFLVLFNKTTGADYSFTNGNLVKATINPAVGQITNYQFGVATDLNTIIYNKGSNYTPSTGSATYRGVSLTGGAGTGAVADITVTNGQVQNVDLRRGGTGYVVSNALSANAADIGGTGSGFSIPVTATEQRLYVDLVDAVKFIGTSTITDFIADNNASVLTINSLTTGVQKTFNAQEIGSSGDVDYTNSRITIASHGYSDGDPVIYNSGVNTAIAPLTINGTFYVRVISTDIIELYVDYALVTKVIFTVSSVGTHQFTILPSNFLKNTFYVPSHGLTTGDPVELAGANLPSGLTSPRYFVGSITTNSFTLHQLRLDALASIGGLTIQAQPLTNAGSGSMTFTVQNVQIVGNINTSSTLVSSYTILSTTNVDASNIVSGIVNTSRLASGAANSDTFLRGDSTWQTVVQSLSPNTDSPISITGSFITLPVPGGEPGETFNKFYSDLKLDIIRASELQGDVNFTNVGIASYSKGQFDVINGQVSVKSGRIDALSLGGLQASFFLDPNNLSVPVPVNRGGTGLSSLPAGSLVFGSTETIAATLALGTANTVLISTGSAPAWSSNLTLPGNLQVNGSTTIGDAAGDGFTITSNTVLVPNTLTFDLENTANNAVSYPIIIRHQVTGVPAIGVGTGVRFETETAGNVLKVGGEIDSVTTGVTAAAENFDMVFKTMTSGAAAAQVLRIRNNRVFVGANNTATTITTQGTGSLTLNTNNGTNSGEFTITSGANGNITVTPNGTGTVNLNKTTNITGDLTVTGTTSIGGVFLTAGSSTNISVLSTVDTFNRTIYRSAKYQIQITCTSGPDTGTFQTSEMLVITDGTNAFKTEYAIVRTGARELATFSVDVSGNDVRLRVTPATSNVIDIRIVRTAQPI